MLTCPLAQQSQSGNKQPNSRTYSPAQAGSNTMIPDTRAATTLPPAPPPDNPYQPHQPRVTSELELVWRLQHQDLLGSGHISGCFCPNGDDNDKRGEAAGSRGNHRAVRGCCSGTEQGAGPHRVGGSETSAETRGGRRAAEKSE